MSTAASSSGSVSQSFGVVGLVLLLIAGFVALPRLFRDRPPKLDETNAKPAPDFTLPVIANESQLDPAAAQKGLSLSALKGHPVVLDFWASWCMPCRGESPIVNNVYKRYKDRGLIVVGVDSGDEQESALAFVHEAGLSFPIVFDGNNRANGAYGITALPTLVLISKDGKVLTTHTGPMSDATLESLVQQAL